MVDPATAEADAEVDSALPRIARVLNRLDRNGRRDDAQAEVPLSSPTRTFLGPVQAGSELGFRCISISAVRGDGVTTARREVEKVIRRMSPDGQVVSLEGHGSEGGLANLAEVVSRRVIIQSARKAGAKGIPRVFRFWVTVAVVLAAIAITAALSLLTPLGGTQERGISSLLHPLSLVSVLGIAALGVLGQLLVNFLSREKNREPPEEKIVDWIATQQNSRSYEHFIDFLTTRFARSNRRRSVVVDDFSRLDRPTRDVLIQYMRSHAGDRPPELWVIFDASDEPGGAAFASRIVSERLDARLTGDPEPPGIRRAQLYELAPLNAKQKNDVAAWAGKPDRVGHRTVKAIVTEEDDNLLAYFEQQVPPSSPRQDPGHYAAFELLYLLSIAATSGGTTEWPSRALLKKLAEQRQRSLVLREILTGSGPVKQGPSKTNIATRLERIEDDFKRVITANRRGADVYLSVPADVGKLLERLSGRFGLADSSLGHLFWALYRNDSREATADSTFWLYKSTVHLLRAASPRDYAEQFGADADALTDRLFSAILDAVGDCLRLSQLARVPELLQRAANLLESDDQRNRAALLRYARDAYAVLADDTILRILLDLRTSSEPAVAKSTSAAARSALELFIQANAGASQIIPTTAAFDPGHSLAGLKADAELRGSWLALSLRPFLAAQQGQLLLAARQAQLLVPEITNALLSTQVEQAAERVVADLVNLSIGLWCWALSGSLPYLNMEDVLARSQRLDIGDALETAHLLAVNLSGAGSDEVSRRDAKALDFAQECLVQELLTVTAAAALVVRQKWLGLPEKSLEKVDEVLNESMRVLQQDRDGAARQDALATLLERMSLLQVTWNALGYRRLAMALNARRIQFSALLTPSTNTQAGSRDVEHASLEDRDQANLLGLLVNLALAQHALPSAEGAAEALVYGVTAALGAEMAETFSVELCAIAIEYAHAYETSLKPVVRYLLETSQTDSSGTRLDWLLASTDESQLVSVVLEILNVATRSGDHEPQLVKALRIRAKNVSGDVASRLEELFTIHDLVRKQRANEPVELDQELDRWIGHEKSASYPYVLFRLIEVDSDPLPSRLKETVTDVLDNFPSYLGENGVVLLSVRLASRFSRQARTGTVDASEFSKDSIVNVLRTVPGNIHAAGLSVDANIDVFEFLSRFDLEHGDDYSAQLRYWREEKLRLIEERDLPHLMSAGRYVLVMLAYVDTLAEYGLSTVIQEGENPISLSGTTISAEESAQLSRAAARPFLMFGTKSELNSQFVLGSRKLFGSGVGKDPLYDDLRYEFNNAARDSMPKLFAFLSELPRLPKSILGILERHERIVRSRVVTQDPSFLL